MKWTSELKQKLVNCTSDVELLKSFPDIQIASLQRQQRLFKQQGFVCTKETTDEVVEKDIIHAEYKHKEKTVNDKYKVLLQEINLLKKERDAAIQLSETPQSISIEPKHKSSKSESTAIIVCSDWHIEEIVRPENVNFLNEFNLDIADKRIKNLFKNAVRLVKMNQSETEINTIVLSLLGDFLSGTLHEELLSNTSLRPMDAILKAMEYLKFGINYLLDNTKCKLVIPCHVGNHCFALDTAILTDIGFVNIQEITEQTNVASFNKESGKISYDKPIAIKKVTDDKAYHIYGNFSDELVTGDHNLVLNGEFVKAKDFKECGQNNFRYCGFVENKKSKYDIDILKLITWVATDGTMVDRKKYGESGYRIQFKLSKQRKIDSLTKLLDKIGIPYTLKKATMSTFNILQPYYIRIYGEWAKKIYNEYFNGIKIFPELFRYLTEDELREVLNTISETDGRVHGNSIEWSSVQPENINIIQQACITNNIQMKYYIRKRTSGFKNSNPLYVASIYPDGLYKKSNNKVKKEIINGHHEFIGIQTKNGTVITQRNGKVNFTGNSRITKYTHHSNANGNSLEYLMYHALKMQFSGEKRIEWLISEGYHSYLDVYNKKLRFSHGDSIKFFGGIGGLFVPVKRAISQWNIAKNVDMDIIGHFHSRNHGGNFITNGSLIGYNAFALAIKAAFEKPTQVFLLINKTHGESGFNPIFLED